MCDAAVQLFGGGRLGMQTAAAASTVRVGGVDDPLIVVAIRIDGSTALANLSLVRVSICCDCPPSRQLLRLDG